MSDVDAYGRDMDEPVTVTLPRRSWWLVRNQLRNQADDWRHRAPDPMLAGNVDAAADEIDRQVLAAPETSEGEGEE